MWGFTQRRKEYAKQISVIAWIAIGIANLASLPDDQAGFKNQIGSLLFPVRCGEERLHALLKGELYNVPCGRGKFFDFTKFSKGGGRIIVISVRDPEIRESFLQ